MDVNQVSIKAPEFLETSAVMWFSIMEAQFYLKSVTVETTKFFSVIANLPVRVLSKVPLTVINSQSYSELKDAVVSAYERTKPELLDSLMKSASITGRPSAYLNELQAISDRIGVGEDIIRHKFLQALPPSIAPVLASQKEMSFPQLGQLADELMPLLASGATTFGVRNVQATTAQQVRKCNIALPIGLKPFGKDQKPVVCRAHLYFGEKARTCKNWCRWPAKRGNLQLLPNSRPSSPIKKNQEN